MTRGHPPTESLLGVFGHAIPTALVGWNIESLLTSVEWSTRERRYRNDGTEPASGRLAPQEWKEDDLEDDDWHEDSYTWREKDRARNVKPFDPNDPDAFLSQAMAGSGMQMMFATLYPGTHTVKTQTEKLGAEWASKSFPLWRECNTHRQTHPCSVSVVPPSIAHWQRSTSAPQAS